MINHDNIILKAILSKNYVIRKHYYNNINKYKNITNYLNNRYNDSISLRETIGRMIYKIEIRPICKECGKPVMFIRFNKNEIIYRQFCSLKCAGKNEENKNNIKKTWINKYGVDHVFKLSYIREKSKNTLKKHYGVDNPLKSDKIKNKVFNTNVQKYGSICPLNNEIIKEKSKNTLKKHYGVDIGFKSEIIKERIKNTSIKKYGVEQPYASETAKQNRIKTLKEKYNVTNISQCDIVKEKKKQTCLKRFGVDNYFMTRKNIEYIHSEPILFKINETKRKNHTFNTSKSEERCYSILIEHFSANDVERQYKSDLYPFQCDFYIKSINTYIECNFHWTHGGHLFDLNNKDDIKKLEQLNEKAKTSKFYNNAIKVWTERDVNKHNVANKNNLNYLVFYNEKDFIDYFSET